MVRSAFLLTPVALLAACGVGLGDPVAVSTKEARKPIKGDEKRAGLDQVERTLQMGNAGFRYVQTVDPKQGDQPVVQQYGDYILGCTFPQIWNWDGEYFLDVQVTRPNEKPFIANRAMLQEGIYVLEQGRRGVAEMVWPLPPLPEGSDADAGRLAVRIVKPADEPTWFYVEARLEGSPEAAISQVRVGTYPFITTGPPERQRWITTLTSGYHMTDAQTPFDPATEWGVVLHNKVAQEDGGCLFVFEPSEVQSARAGGTYCVGLTMDSAPGLRAAHLAFGYFWDTNYAKAIADFRPQAPQVLDRLSRLDWSVTPDAGRWQRMSAEITELLSHQGMPEQFGARWPALSQEAQAALGAAPTREAERKFGLLAAQAEKLKSEMYGAALEALVKEAGQ